MIVIGLTGGIASGKSTVSEVIMKMNIPVIDADLIAREIVDKNSGVLSNLVKEFGIKILNKNGTLNRKHLGEIVFNNEDKLRRLNTFTHPAIKNKMVNLINNYRIEGRRCCVVDAALLIEGNFLDLVDIVILVYVNEEVQASRLMERDGLTYSEAKLRIKSQMPLEDKKKYANYLIDNSKDIEFAKKQVVEIIYEVLNLEECNV